MDGIRVFVSSKQSEFESERELLKHEIERFTFLIADLAADWPPQAASSREVFLAKVQQAPIYVGLFGCVYSESTQLEYETAIQHPHREILIYVRSCARRRRDPQLQALIADMKDRHAIKEYETVPDLILQFQEHLLSALVRMAGLLMKLGDLTKSQVERGGDVFATIQLSELGLPVEQDKAGRLAHFILRGLEAAKQ